MLALALVLAGPVGGAATPRHGGGAKPKPTRMSSIATKRKPRRHVRKVRRTLGDRAALLALHEVGTPYAWGGEGPGGFDCSGLTSWVYGKLGVLLPHNAAAQFGVGRAVQRSRLRRGNLLFFHGLGHVGIYLGEGRMVHAPQSGRSVEVVRLADHYAEGLVGARRIHAPSAPSGNTVDRLQRLQSVPRLRSIARRGISFSYRHGQWARSKPSPTGSTTFSWRLARRHRAPRADGPNRAPGPLPSPRRG